MPRRTLSWILLLFLVGVAPANTLRVPSLRGSAQLSDDDLGDLGDLDDEDFLDDDTFDGGMDGDGDGLDGEDPFDSGGLFDDDPDFPEDGDIPDFPGEEPVLHGPVTSRLVPGGEVSYTEVADSLTAFADLLGELRARKVKRPFHELALRRLEVWVELHGSEVDELGDELPERLETLLNVARDPELELPESEKQILAEYRGGVEEIVWDDGEEADFFGDELSDIEWLTKKGEGEPAPTEPEWTLPADDPDNPFRIFRVRNQLAKRVFAPLDAEGWRAWLERSEDDEAALADGLAEMAGTEYGRRVLKRAVAAGIPDAGARVVAGQLGEFGTGDDLVLLSRIERANPKAKYAVQLARGRLQERVDRYQGMDRWDREHSAKTLLQQAKIMANKGDLRRALRFAQEAVEVAPRPAGPQYQVARYAYQVGYYQKSREALEAAFRQGVSHRSYFTTYAKVMRRQGERDTLMNFLDRALDRGGRTELKVTLCNELALEHSAKGDGAKAVELAKIGLGYYVPDVLRDNLLTRYAEGMTLLGKFDEAEDAFSRAVRLDARYRKARTGLAAVRALKKRKLMPDPDFPAPEWPIDDPTEDGEQDIFGDEGF